MLRAFILASSLTTGCLFAQDPTARADATSNARSDSSSSHRVEVVNGKTVVDEKTVNGKRVPSGTPAGAPIGRGALDDMMREVERKMGEGGGKVSKDLKSSSSSHRVRVVNGKTVLDEKTVDGKSVPPGARREVPMPVDLDSWMRDADRRMKDGMKSDSSRSSKSSSSKSSSSDSSKSSKRSSGRTAKIVNGKIVLDDAATVDRDPVTRRTKGAKPGGSRVNTTKRKAPTKTSGSKNRKTLRPTRRR